MVLYHQRLRLKMEKKEGKYTEYFTTSLFVLGGGPSQSKNTKMEFLLGM